MSVDPAGDGLVAAVPEYVHYVVLELLKNAMRATMQAHGAGTGKASRVGGKGGSGSRGDAEMDVAGEEDARVHEREKAEAAEGGSRRDDAAGGAPAAAAIVFADVPEVVISVRAHGDDDVMLLVADQGGGIPAEATDKVHTYSCSRASSPQSWLVPACCRRRVLHVFLFLLCCALQSLRSINFWNYVFVALLARLLSC